MSLSIGKAAIRRLAVLARIDSAIRSFTFLKSKVVPMRQLAPTVVLQVLVALPLAAQFEGTISMKVSAGGGDMMMTMSLKGDQQSTVMTLPASAGPLAGMEARM